MRLRVRSINFKGFKNLWPHSKTKNNHARLWSNSLDPNSTAGFSFGLRKKLFFGLLAIALLGPAPYVIITPGEPENVLAKTIQISGATTYPTTGKLS